MSHPVDEQAVIALRALAHPVRLGIMQELAKHPGACDVAEVFAVAQPTMAPTSTPCARPGDAGEGQSGAATGRIP